MFEPTEQELENARTHLHDVVDDEGGTYESHVFATIRYLNKNARDFGGGMVSLGPYIDIWPEEKIELFKVMLFDHGVRFDRYECMSYDHRLDNSLQK